MYGLPSAQQSPRWQVHPLAANYAWLVGVGEGRIAPLASDEEVV